MHLSIEDACGDPPSSMLVERTAQAVLERMLPDVQPGIDFYLCDNSEIHHLNLQYRKRDCPTDVLSFAYVEPVHILSIDPGEQIGDIAISLEYVRASAREHQVSYEQELRFVTIHGVLHLLGYDHEDDPEQASRMRECELSLLAQLEGSVGERA